MQFNPQVQRILDDVKSQPVTYYNMNTFNKLPPSYNDPTPLIDYITPEKIKRAGNDRKYFNSFSEAPRVISSQTYEKQYEHQRRQNPIENRAEIQNPSQITHNRDSSNSYIRYVSPRDFQIGQNLQRNYENQTSYIPPPYDVASSFAPNYATNNIPSDVPNSFFIPGNKNYYANTTQGPLAPSNTAINQNAEQDVRRDDAVRKIPEKQTIILERGDRETGKRCCC